MQPEQREPTTRRPPASSHPHPPHYQRLHPHRQYPHVSGFTASRPSPAPPAPWQQQRARRHTLKVHGRYSFSSSELLSGLRAPVLGDGGFSTMADFGRYFRESRGRCIALRAERRPPSATRIEVFGRWPVAAQQIPAYARWSLSPGCEPI